MANKKQNTAPVTPVTTDALSKEQALEILNGLIAKPDTNASDIPSIFQGIVATFNQAFAPAPVAEVVKKRKRRRLNPDAKPLGWPAGVSRAEFKTWKEQQIAGGATEGLNPWDFKALRDAGKIPTAQATDAPKAEKPAKATKKAEDNGEKATTKKKEKVPATASA